MALTATASQGFELERHTTEHEKIWVASDPGDTFTKGMIVNFTAGEGVADASTANEVVYGVVMEKVISPAATDAGFPMLAPNGDRSWGQVLDSQLKTLVAIKPMIPAGLPIHRVTFQDHKDDTVISYTAATRAIAATTGHTADDYPNGALLYVYEGAGAGQWNIVEDYDHTGGAAELLLICHRIFNTALDSTSKYIVLTGEGATNKGVYQLGRTAAASGAITVEVDDHANDGDLMVYLDARDVQKYLKNLMLPVIKAGHMLLA